MKKRKTPLSGFVIILLGLVIGYLLYVNVIARKDVDYIGSFGEAVGKSRIENVKPTEYTEEEKQSAIANFVDGDYYYDKISESEKLIYQEIYNSILTREAKILSTKDENIISKVFNAVCDDHPEVFYISGYTYTQISYDDKLLSCEFLANYDYDESEVQRRQSQIENSIQSILLCCQNLPSDYDKVKYVYEYLIQNNDYVLNALDNQNICSVFITNQTVCAGYAKATQVLLRQLGIPCIYVTGTTKNNESHAWNYAFCDGSWYILDTTWGDSTYQNENYNESNAPSIFYNYLLMDTNTANKTHFPTNLEYLPVCIDDRDNYFVKEGLYLSTYDEAMINDMVSNAFFSGIGEVQIRMRDYDTFQKVFQYLITEQGVFEIVPDINQVNYIEDTDLFTISIWSK